MRPLRIFISSIAALGLLPAIAFGEAFVAPAPEDLMIYQVFVDRFNDGDSANNHGNPRGTYNPSSPSAFHGGDLEGVRQKLSYIKGLGVNGIWLSPIVENVNAYHGYHAYNWYNVDPNFGTMDKARQLVTEANDLGIAVYFDAVMNHCGDLINSNDAGYPAYKTPPNSYTLRWVSGLHYPAPFDSLSYFHAQGTAVNFTGDEETMGDLSGLDDLKTETTYVRDNMFLIYKNWILQTGASGFRVDTVNEVDVGFWEDFFPRMRTEAVAEGKQNFYAFGEVYGGDDARMAKYLGTMNGGPYKLDAALDFQYYYRVVDVFAKANQAPSSMMTRLQNRATALPAHNLKMPNWLDNHDLARFLYSAGQNPGSGKPEQLRRLELGLVFLFASPGPPIVYYGTEQNFSGGSDPYDREDMFAGQFKSPGLNGDSFDSSSPHYQLISKLAAARAASVALRRGSLSVHSATSSGPGVISFSRISGSEEVIVTMNTSMVNFSQPAFLTNYPNGTVMRDVLTPINTVTLTGGVFPSAILAAQEYHLWIAEPPATPTPTATPVPTETETPSPSPSATASPTPSPAPPEGFILSALK